MARIITLKFAGKCTDCGTKLVKGATAQWISRGIISGIDCHASSDELGIRWDSGRGVAVQRGGRCEDAPCCGCCG